MRTTPMRTKLPLLLLCTVAPALAEVSVENAWVRGLPPGVGTTSAYMTLVNDGSEPVELTGVSTVAAGQALLHGVMDHGGMLHMMALDSLTVPAGGELRLESRGSHIMLADLPAELVVGSTVELVLEFADGRTLAVTAPVRSVLDE